MNPHDVEQNKSDPHQPTVISHPLLSSDSVMIAITTHEYIQISGPDCDHHPVLQRLQSTLPCQPSWPVSVSGIDYHSTVHITHRGFIFTRHGRPLPSVPHNLNHTTQYKYTPAISRGEQANILTDYHPVSGI